jgi:hypothetical protein
VLAACSAASTEPAGSASSAIVDGSTDPNDVPVGFVWLPNSSGSLNFCTGTLITPDVVLTAAGCLVDEAADGGIAPRSPDRVGFRWGPGRAVPFNQGIAEPWGQPYTVDAVAIAPAWVPGSPAYDVALLHLIYPVNITTPASYGGAPPAPGSYGRAIGFGVNYDTPGFGNPRAGERRRATLVADTVGATDFVMKRGDGIACLGDQGGPLIFDDAIVGVASVYGESYPCGDTQAYARLGTVAPWIQSTIAGWKQTLLGFYLPIQISRGYLTVAPGQQGASVDIAASVDGWQQPTNVTFQVDPSSLAPGVTVTYVQTRAANPPQQGVAGKLEVSALQSVPRGTQSTVKVIGVDGVAGYTTTFEVVVDGACVPATCATTNRCGSMSDGCGGTMECGCSDGDECWSGVCLSQRAPDCKPPFRDCGDGLCARICT